ncbi:MAG TPA: mechanosensitive ion channel domain-containing protein, partial [Paracoccaceae bacterium]|nr:mechanosensitive ion channel domain-containing protein [Paracoccaceae bacterium]
MNEASKARWPARWQAGGRAALLGLVLLLGAGSAEAADADASAPPSDGQPDGRVDALLQAFPQGMTPEQLDATLAVMDDQAVRDALRDRLLAEIDRRSAAPPTEMPLAFYGRRLEWIAAAYPGLPTAMADAFARPHGQDAPVSPRRLILGLALILGVGTVVMLLVRRIFAARRRRLAVRPDMRRAQKLSYQGLRLILDLIEIAAFLAGALIAYALMRPPHPAAPAILFLVLNAAAIVLVVERAATFLCDPRQPDLRLIPIADAPARALHRTIVAVVLLTVLVATIVRLFATLGMAPDATIALALPLSVIPFAYLLTLIWRHRHAITTAIADRLRLDLRDAPILGAWPVMATAYLCGLWVVVADAAIRQQPETGVRALTSLLIVVAVPIVALLIQSPIVRFYEGSSSARPAAADQPPAMDEYGDPLPTASAAPVDPGAAGHVNRLMRAVWVVLIFLAVIVTARLWGYDPSQHEGFAGIAVRALFQIGIVLLLAYVGWALIVHWIDRTLDRASQRDDEIRAHRLATLLPLLRKFLLVVMIIVVAMVMLSSLGIEIGPLLAGAGVVGLAIGLGAQSTIANILAGVFFLLEDAFHIGDYVEVGSLRGTVEGISLRSLRLRHHRGAVHTLPFGQIPALTNYTRDWALVRLEFRVSPETDLALVKKLVKDIGKELS